MPRFYLRLILILLIIFTAALLLIHAQPYDDHELRQLLLPEGCPAPCFMGIRPGVTNPEEAANILRSNKWTKNIHVQRNMPDNASSQIIAIDWDWSEFAPKLLKSNNTSHKGYISINQNKVNQIALVAPISLGAIWLTWGNPSEYMWIATDDPQRPQLGTVLLYHIIYHEYNFMISGVKVCPYLSSFWQEDIIIFIKNTDNESSLGQQSTDNHFIQRVKKLNKQTCRS